jgi:S-formylglutathione hydrolase
MTETPPASVLHLGQVDTDLVPGPIEYAALTPPEAGSSPLALVLLLHGGNGSRDLLAQTRPAIEQAWADGRLAPAVVVTPSCRRSFYMNFRDGSERWEDVVLGPIVDAARRDHGATDDPARTAVAGISMGGMGALRIAFKHPERFAAVVGMEPGIEPALSFGEIDLEDRFWRDDALFEQIYGAPVDEAYWAENNPANLVLADPARLRDSGLAIALECGDLDSFGLHRGTEFLHRILFDQGVPHDYHLVRGADHLGRSLGPRIARALDFLGVALDPPAPDPTLAPLHTMIANLRKRAGLDP